MSDTVITDNDGEEINPTEAVTQHLDAAIQAAREGQMSTSELMGLFFYYAHSIAASYRESFLMASGEGEAE
ncbi:MAG: hypothetical protein U1A22_15270 [Xanthomonadaceae bacterium]|nr:hypothetical protein [Xanthomonadaceae bacterium]